MYWFLVVRKDLNPRRKDLSSVKGLRIGAAPGPVDGLKQLLKRAGIDPERDVQIGPVPGSWSERPPPSACIAAKALEEGKIDGFWANGMGAEVAVSNGIGTAGARRAARSTRRGEGLHLSRPGRLGQDDPRKTR